MPKRTRRIKITDKHKAWNRRSLTGTPRSETRETKKLFLVICEGNNTEPAYFESFPLSNADVQSFGTGSSKTALVKQVINILASDEEARLKEVWVVFDFDVQPDQLTQQKEDYNHAIELAQKNGIQVACSNDAFELWFLLHYEYLDMQWTRHQYYEKLSELWDYNYEKNGKTAAFCRKIYQLLNDDEIANQSEAINRAKRLDEKQNEETFADKNPHTSVYKLVKELNQYL